MRNCPVCGGKVGDPFIVRTRVPVHQNTIHKTRSEACDIALGTLSICLCPNCGFAFNSAFDPSKLCYDQQYEPTQDCSAVFDRYIDDHVLRLVGDHGVRGARIIEVGCGKGGFLRRLVDAHPRNRGRGYDPSYEGPDEDLDGRLQFRKRFFGPSEPDCDADIIIARHVIEHVADPVSFLKGIREATIRSPDARVCIETPSLEWIIEHNVFWDLFYEHCNYFTQSSLRAALEAAGYRVVLLKRTFSDQYLWVEARTASGRVPLPEPAAVEDPVREFAIASSRFEEVWRSRLEALSTHGRVAVWGAGAKGVTFVNVLDRSCKTINCVVDINPKKQGHYVPGTGHPIVSPQKLEELEITNVIVMNPNYELEVIDQVRELRLAATVEVA